MFTKVLSPLAFLLFVLISFAGADITFYDPTSSTPPLRAAEDFATDILANPWDFDSANDLADYYKPSDLSGITTPAFNDGIMSFTMTTGDGFFYLLSPGVNGTNALGKNGQNIPINSSKYHWLSIRMYSSTSSSMRVLFNRRRNYFEDFCHTTPIQTTAGWKTYTVDLNSLGCATSNGVSPAWSSQNVTGLRIDPSATAGASISIDWITLSANAPADSHPLNYAVAGGTKRASLFLDDDTNPYNGVVRELASNISSYSPVSIAAEHLDSGSYYVTGLEANDFASLFRDPWDMYNPEDIFITSGMSASVSNGFFGGATSDGGSALYLNLHNRVIDTSIFKYFSMSLNVASPGMMIVVWYDSNGAFIGQEFTPVVAGVNNIQIDLSGNGAWSGNVGQLRITPISTAGVNFAIDYISLRNDTFGPTDAPDVSGIRVAPAPLRVNAPATMTFVQPDEAGGVDFAANVLGNPWDFGDMDDIYKDELGVVRVHNVVNPRILPNNFVNGRQGNFYCASNVAGIIDPYQISHFTTDPSKAIDTSRFKNVVYKMWVNHFQDFVLGSMVRMVWQGARVGGVEPTFYNSDDQISKEGWNQYIQNMDDIILEPDQHPDGSYPATPWASSGNATYFRVDAHEFTPSTEFCFDQIKVTAYDEANNSFAITYAPVDKDGDNASISFFYNSTKSTSGGTLIGTKNINDPTRVLVWDTSAIPNGIYWLYAVSNDGVNTTSQLASGRISINHSLPQDVTPPALAVEFPVEGTSVYDTFSAEGYSVDGTQIATIEVSVDGALVDTIQPEHYHSGAYALYSSLADGSTAGFRKLVDISDVSAGAHTLRFRSFDTAGNYTDSSMNIIKIGGADPAPRATPTPTNAAELEIPLVSETPTPTPTPSDPTPRTANLTFTASLNKKTSKVTLTIGGSQTCSTVELIGSPKRAEVQSGVARTVKSYTAAASISKTSKKISKNTKSAIHLGVKCNGVLASPVRTLSFRKVKGKAIKDAKKFISSELARRV